MTETNSEQLERYLTIWHRRMDTLGYPPINRPVVPR